MQYPLPFLLSRARCRGFRRTFALCCRCALPAASVAFVDAVVALPSADACLVASSFEADADDADDAAELATMRQPFLRILRWFPTLSRSFRMSSLRKQTRCCAGLFSGFASLRCGC
ncbi:hypothetical protein H6S20_11570 [Escherichia coli]|nr:hypothetical protein H6S20_11570 [Escherichia coli]